MKTEQMLEKVMAVLERYETMQNAKGLYDRGIRGAAAVPFYELADLALDLREQMSQEAARAAGRGGARAAMLRVIKNTSRPYLNGAWMDGEQQVVCDGYRAIRLNTPLDLPSPELVDKNKRVPLEIGELIPTDLSDIPLDLPDIGTLKAYIKAQNAEQKARGIRARERKICWDFGEGLPMVDARYMLDMLEALPGAQAYPRRGGYNLSPIVFKSDAGEGLLCPVHKKASTTEGAA